MTELNQTNLAIQLLKEQVAQKVISILNARSEAEETIDCLHSPILTQKDYEYAPCQRLSYSLGFHHHKKIINALKTTDMASIKEKSETVSSAVTAIVNDPNSEFYKDPRTLIISAQNESINKAIQNENFSEETRKILFAMLLSNINLIPFNSFKVKSFKMADVEYCCAMGKKFLSTDKATTLYELYSQLNFLNTLQANKVTIPNGVDIQNGINSINSYITNQCRFFSPQEIYFLVIALNEIGQKMFIEEFEKMQKTISQKGEYFGYTQKQKQLIEQIKEAHTFIAVKFYYWDAYKEQFFLESPTANVIFAKQIFTIKETMKLFSDLYDEFNQVKLKEKMEKEKDIAPSFNRILQATE